MHTVQLILRPTEYEKAVINKRFHAVSHIHNVSNTHVSLNELPTPMRCIAPMEVVSG